ncbi:PepSY-associated TM helix domain-containing protein [Methylocapsa palsarum]|uniref:Uncharacterized iron-regulated membrane protein n=1 Tax=Methylocapsa palsarum TaxID=1612308 RepID=A0A1I4CNH2_9HYPH|nr:PepSY-associated TM helix domain-containing protein [Methylocapsa palsarum]SFK82798.1 Uncharacterized iron-regulated membrane protein [Methylocapsa palsarum]
MTRQFWVLMHRYSGLTMTLFLVITGLTGSVLAFKDELDLWLNPDLLTVAKHDAPMLDPLVLRGKAEAQDPRMRVDSAPLYVEPGRSFEAGLAPRVKSAPIEQFVALPDFLAGAFGDDESGRVTYLDPYTGETLGERNLTAFSVGRANIIWFIYRLHMTLALPGRYSGLGAFILGVTALVWTIDCFVSFYLTFPRSRASGGAIRKTWLSRWKPAWLIKWSGGAYRINFDIHRAFGLWTFAMLFIFAWSSVGFNLNEVYTPVMNALFGAPPPQPHAMAMPTRAVVLENPALDWPEARARGRVLLEEKARKDGFTIKREVILALDRESGRYTMCANTLAAAGESPACAEFDAETGAEASKPEPDPQAAKTPLSETISSLLAMLHMARVFGLPMKIFVCVMGLVITMLSVTGVYIWWKKRRARMVSKARREAMDGESAAAKIAAQ